MKPFLRMLAGRLHRDRRLIFLIVALVCVAGGSSALILPRMEDPILVKRAAMITTRLPGADAIRVESQVTEPIENQLREIEEIKELRSVSRTGMSIVSIELLDSVKQSAPIWSRVRSRVNDALPRLPGDAQRPIFEELEVRAHALIVAVCWTGEGPADRRMLRRLAIDLQDRLQNLPGTETVERFGDPGEEIEVTVDPTAASALGVSVDQVAGLVGGQDAESPAGQLRDDSTRLLMEVGNQIDAVEDLRRLPLVDAADRQVLLGEVADVRMGIVDPPPRLAEADGAAAVVVGAMVRPEYRIDRWTVAAEDLLEDYRATLPDGVDLQTLLRQSDYVNSRLRSLGSNLAMGAAAVTVVIIVMMGWRSALLVTMTLPLSCLVVLFVLRLLAVPIHQMSITGLIIALGLLIDNAIVVVDEIRLRLTRGCNPVEAMTETVAHLAVPLLGSTITTALAFAPIALMPGPAGEFVGAISISVIAAIFASLLLSLTVIASISARSLAGSLGGSHGARRETFWTHGLRIGPLTSAFRGFLRVCLRHPPLGIAISLVLPAIGFGLAPTLREQFFPPSGRNQFYIAVDGPSVASLQQTVATAHRVDAIARQADAVRRIDWFYGDSAPQFYYNVVGARRENDNYAQGLVTLREGVDPMALIQRLQREMNRQVTSARVLVRQLEQGPPFEAPIEARLFGPDPAELRRLGREIRRRLAAMPEVAAVRSDMEELLPQVTLDLDERVVGRLQVSPRQIAAQLAASLDGMPAGRVLQDNEELPIMVRVGRRDRADLARIGSMPIEVPAAEDGGGRSTLVAAVASPRLVPEAAAIPRLNRRRMNEVLGYLHAGVLPSIVQTRLERSLADNPLDLPAGYRLEFAGEASKRDDAVGNLLSTVGVLGTLMVATLVLSFGSFRAAGMIGIVAVLSMGLGLAALAIAGYPFGFTAIIGTMGLIGVAINDSIVILAAIRANPAAASGAIDAMVEEVLQGTRHIVATTLTTMAGFTPLILDGGDFWPPMAVCIAGGVLGATLLALVLVPSVYRLLHRRGARPQ